MDEYNMPEKYDYQKVKRKVINLTSQNYTCSIFLLQWNLSNRCTTLALGNFPTSRKVHRNVPKCDTKFSTPLQNIILMSSPRTVA